MMERKVEPAWQDDQHIANRNQWASHSVIDWVVLEAFARTKLVPITFSVKFIHSILPSGKIAHRNDPTASPTCPMCGTLETNNHVLTCAHPTQTQYKLQILSHICSHKSCQQSDPVLVLILCEGLSAALCSTPLDSTSFSAPNQLLCAEQATIGWLNLLQGFASPEWRRLHASFCHRTNVPSSPSAIGPLASVRTSWKIIRTLWKFRNTQRHDLLDSEHNSEMERRANATIRKYYALKERVLPTDRVLFAVPLSDQLTHLLSTNLAWISSHSTYLDSSLKQAAARNLHQMHPITSYFASTT